MTSQRFDSVDQIARVVMEASETSPRLTLKILSVFRLPSENNLLEIVVAPVGVAIPDEDPPENAA